MDGTGSYIIKVPLDQVQYGDLYRINSTKYFYNTEIHVAGRMGDFVQQKFSAIRYIVSCIHTTMIYYYICEIVYLPS